METEEELANSIIVYDEVEEEPKEGKLKLHSVSSIYKFLYTMFKFLLDYVNAIVFYCSSILVLFVLLCSILWIVFIVVVFLQLYALKYTS